MKILATIFSGFSLLMGLLFFLLPKPRNFTTGFYVWFPKLAAGALSLVWTIMGAVGAVIGWSSEAYWAIPIGVFGAGMMVWYGYQCTREHNGFEEAFGPGWSEQIPPNQTRRMSHKRWSVYMKMSASPPPSWERDVPFWTIPGTDRELLCDIWRPAGDHVSGLAFIYIHGGAWYFMDKDMFTRPFFRHLVAQGHTVMDVSYRLCPEVDIHGMIGDVKHAIAWMKSNADRFGVDPEKIVLGGASAGGHLALLAGYAPGHPELTPEDLNNADLSVRGIISYYPPTDLMIQYQYTKQGQYIGLPPVSTGPDATLGKGDFGRFDTLFGGHPQDMPDIYQLASPATHVHPGSPPTLLVHGDQDSLIPVDGTHALYTKLVESGVPAIKVIFPWTTHGFDLLAPQINPPVQTALYDVDRFLALLSNQE
jgi:acetyl esterase/lipase